MKVYNLTSLCALATVVSASPLVQERSDACQVVDVVVSALKLYKATPFCSSFLGIQTATAVVTSTAVSQTTTVVPGPTTLTTVVTATIVSTETDVTTTDVTTTQTVDVTDVITIETTVTESTSTTYTLRKRDLPTPPSFLKAFASSKISQACSCLSIPTPTTTTTTVVTTTATALTTGPTVVSTIDTSASTATTVTSIDIETILATQSITTSTTTTETSTSLVVATSTFIPAACQNQQLISNGYFPHVTRQFKTVGISSSYSAQRCCALCWETPNCILWAFGGFLDVPADATGDCYSILGTDQTTPATANLQGLCPLGISATEQLALSEGANTQGIYAAGPCDVSGAQYI